MVGIGARRRALVFGWGCATDGRLGLRSSAIVPDLHEPFGKAAYTPRRVEALDDQNVRAIACGSGHSVFLGENGDVWTSGMGFAGQLGHGRAEDETLPKRVEGLPPCKAIAAGETHTLAVSEEGFVFGFGGCVQGQLGLGRQEKIVSSPEMISSFLEVGERIAKVAAGKGLSAAISDAGRLYTFGNAYHGALGHGSKPTWSLLRPFAGLGSTENTPRLVQALKGEPVANVTFGLSHTLAVLRSGDVIGWGSASNWGFGDPDPIERLEPKECKELSALGVEKIAIGTTQSLALTMDGDVYSWGVNMHGELGNGSVVKSARTPRSIGWFHANSASTGRVKDISAGMFFSCAATERGVTAWGHGLHGKIGFDYGKDHLKPGFVLLDDGSKLTATSVSSGLLHSLAISPVDGYV